MIPDVVWEAFGLQFKIYNILYQFPLSWNHKDRKLVPFRHEKSVRLFPWYFIMLSVLVGGLGSSVCVLAYDLFTQKSFLNLLQILFSVIIASMAALSSTFALFLLFGRDLFSTVFNSLSQIETEVGLVKSSRIPPNWRQQVLVSQVDPSGIAMVAMTAFFSVTPLAAPVVVYFDLDPTFVTHDIILYIVPSLTAYSQLIRFGCIIMRVCCIFVAAVEQCRLMTLMQTYGILFMKLLKNLLCWLYESSNTKWTPVKFEMLYSKYLRLTTITKLLDEALGPLVAWIMAASIIVYGGCGYASVALRSVIQMPMYLFFPCGFVLGNLSNQVVLGAAIENHESSVGLLGIWKFKAAEISNKKYVVRKLRATSPLKLHAKMFGYSMYYLKQSTIVTLSNETTNHMINAILSFPVSNT
jgi:hypothetical protein